jgi:hypothetical protein
MAETESLTKDEKRLWKYIKDHDFEGHPWSTPAAAKALDMDEDKVYSGLSDLSKKLKGDIYIYYKDDAIRIATEHEKPAKKKK